MKVNSFLAIAATLISSLSFAVEADQVLTNTARPSVKITIVSATPEGVPNMIQFSNKNEVLVLADVTANDDGIDISVGEVYDVTGPFTEGDVCNLNAKLSFVGEDIKISFNPVDVGSAFSNLCPNLAALSGLYK